MKKLITGICIVSLMGLSDIYAQHDKITWKNDPTYSVHNYKHPNKAAAAKKLQKQNIAQIVTVQEPSTTQSITKVMIPKRRIEATYKTSNGKEKTPLAIRRKSSEKQFENIESPVNQDQIDD
jgi:hypothetical protein